MSATNFYRPVDRVEIRACKHVETPESGVRTYCVQSPHIEGGRWCLQVRAYETLANGQTGSRFLIGSAHLDRDTMRSLRDAMSAFLEECDAT
jgi:hypothetical protein